MRQDGVPGLSEPTVCLAGSTVPSLGGKSSQRGVGRSRQEKLPGEGGPGLRPEGQGGTG